VKWVLRSRIWLYRAVLWFLISMHDEFASRAFWEAQYRWTAWESSKIVLNNPPKCDDSTSASLDDRAVILNQIQTSFDARWNLANFCAFHKDTTRRAKKIKLSTHEILTPRNEVITVRLN
jgi:hypothetical protein